MQITPSPTKPPQQVQWNELTVLLHKAFNEQLWVPAVHSSISKKKAGVDITRPVIKTCFKEGPKSSQVKCWPLAALKPNVISP